MATGEGASRTGGCLCGAVRFSAVPLRPEIDACHCGMCRKWSGGVFLAVPCGESVSVEDASALLVYRSSDHAERASCRTCGASLFWRLHDGSHAAVSLQAFDDASGLVFVEEIFIEDKPDAYEFANPTAKRTGADVMAAFAAAKDS